jgi:uncharacterized protein (DUF58 family)
VSTPVPTWRLAVAALAVVPLVVFVPLAFFVANAVLLAVVAADLALAPSPRSINVRRDLPSTLTMGAVSELCWTVHGTKRRSARVSVADGLAPSLGADIRRFSTAVGAGTTTRATTQIRPTRRGRFALGPVTLRVFGPLGLIARQRTMTVPGELRVLPPFRSRAEAELRMHRSRLIDVGARSARGRGGGTEFDQLREYTTDDEFRRIDWAATARTGRAVVRTYRAERNQTVLVLLDCGRTMAGMVEGVPRLEHAMDAIMMLAAVTTHLGDRVGMTVYDRETRLTVTASSGRSQVARFTEAFAEVEAELVESDLRAAVIENLGRRHRRSLVVVVTELSLVAVDEVLLAGLAALRHHQVIVVSVSDPEVSRWVADSAAYGDGDDDVMQRAYRSAAAAAAQAQRRRAAARLRGAGALVVDGPPGKVATQLADTYLELKATGRL